MPANVDAPVTLPAAEAPRTALSTIATAEFPHLYALREMLSSVQFLHVDLQASRRPTDRLAPRQMLPDASTLQPCSQNFKSGNEQRGSA